jgi:hypothetical protein
MDDIDCGTGLCLSALFLTKVPPTIAIQTNYVEKNLTIIIVFFQHATEAYLVLSMNRQDHGRLTEHNSLDRCAICHSDQSVKK